MESFIQSILPGRGYKPLTGFNQVEAIGDLKKLGIGFDALMSAMEAHPESYGMDSLQAGVTTSSISTPVQFLQSFLPGNVAVLTAARKIDDLTGIATVGAWEDEEVVQSVLENRGNAVVYGDTTNVPFASWNQNFERRSVVRFESGMRVGNLEMARAARVRVDSSATKRESCSLALEITRNQIGFTGFNSGNNRTYGFLNDPGLGAYVTVATGAASSTLWAQKTFLEITADIRTAIVALRNQSLDNIDPETTPTTLALPTACMDRLSVTSDLGMSVKEWIEENYPQMRRVSAPQLNAANGGANVFYLYAETVQDVSSDGGAVWMQVVPMRFKVEGVQRLAKGFEEAYSNATAGVMCKRPYAVVRYTGI